MLVQPISRPEAPVQEEPELERFIATDVQEGRRVREIPWMRGLLSGGALLMLGWLASDTLDEVRYHFAEPEIVELGDVTKLDASGLTPQKYVSLTGVLGNKAAEVNGLRPGSWRRGPIQVRQLLGSQVYVEFDQDALYDRYQPFRRVTVKGRLVDFGPGGDLASVRQYFRSHFLMEVPEGARLLIVGETPGEMTKELVIVGVMAVMALLSLLFFARAFRTRVVDEQGFEVA